MNHANLEKSQRLIRVHNLLSSGKEYTTRDIVMQANVCAVNSIISELRENGSNIKCERRGDKWYYRKTATANPQQE